jgi:phosphohistidine phosphatase
VGIRRLTLLRHGKAEAADAYPEDYERPLTHRGIIEAQEMGSRLVKRDLVPDLILVSPAERAWATAEIIATACELDAKQMQCARELYLATPERTWQLLAQRAASLNHIMICGHNPGLSLIASRFGPKPRRRELPTAGIATAVWHHADWSSLQPETADSCEMDDPEDMNESWEYSG